MRLDGRTALVTGGTQGVGAAIAQSLASAGCNLILHGLHDDAQCRATLDRCRAAGVQADVVFADLTAAPDICIPQLIAAVDAICGDAVCGDATYQAVSLLINNAGTFCEEPFLELTPATVERTLRLNVVAGLFLTQTFAKRWIQNGVAGRVLFTGSINGELAEPNHVAYDTSKGAVRTLVRSLCVALAPHSIRVNAIAPGLVVTPLTARVLDQDPDARRWMQMHTPSGQVPGAEVCGGAAVFLLSDEAQHIHGQTLLVDGGMSVWQQPDLPDELRGKLS